MSGVKDQRGLGKQIKRIMPTPVFRALTVIFNKSMRLLPFRLKYALFGRIKTRRAPYSLLNRTDTVVQIGSARDILHTGRSRAVLFSLSVPEGRVVAIEADSESCRELERVVRRYGLGNITPVNLGVWNERGELAFRSSANHPAANVLVDVKELEEDVVRQRRYEEATIPVDTLDEILAEQGAGVPRLVSITTNGAELQILEGMSKTIQEGCEYISLASTGPGFHEHMSELGYEYVFRDDRGYCFRKRSLM